VSAAALLDVNVLVALFDQDHVHHEAAHDWFAEHRSAGWATCPITEAGFVRVLANPSYGNGPTRATELVDRLRRLCAGRHHRFWPCDVSLRDDALFNHARIQGHRYVTDVYLLGLARKHDGRLATFDRTIPLAAVKGAHRDLLQVLAPGS
jgi:toxin-antitoxin system PIN domain toxin